jgi:hypothetical protein
MKQIAKGVFQLPLMPRNSINCYLLEDVLIDAGIRSSANSILRQVANHEVNAHRSALVNKGELERFVRQIRS